MVIKTRDRLIEVARKLFLVKGIDNTTMLDIANASDNGRRTVYSYFKNKSDIYSAVVERESEVYVKSAREIAKGNECATEKLEHYIKERFQTMKEVSSHKESLISWFTRESSKNEKIQKAIFAKEELILSDIISEGISSGEFDSDRSTALPQMLPTMIRALWNDINENSEKEAEKIELSFISFVMNGVKRH